LAGKLIAARRRRGLSAKRAAKLLGVDEGTWGRWEQGKAPSYPAHRSLIATFLRSDFAMAASDIRTRAVNIRL
jgi:transcriptional regulator with XRE-family HTH domain